MNNDEILKAIQSEINYHETTKLSQNPSITPTETMRLDLIDRYMASRYRDGDQDSFGNQMVFYNICTFPVDIASKAVDVDTKDIQLLPEDDRYWETWLMEKELRQWMDDKRFGKFLNELVYRLPRDGHVVAKKVDDEVELVPLKNLRFRPDALSLNRTPVIERYEYQVDEFINEAKNRGWENWQNVQMAVDSATQGQFNKGDKVIVFGCWFPEGYLEGVDDNYFLVSYDGQMLARMHQEFFYKDLAWEKVYGRLLGKGYVEKLFNEQIYLNRIANYKADGLNWSSKHWFQTRDNSFKTNLLGNSDNGDVFITNDPIEPVAVEDRNLSFYGQEEQRWEQNAMQRVFSVGPITGAFAPSGTKVGVSTIQAQMSQGYYDPKKENIAMFLKDIIEDWIMPGFKKDVKGSHTLLMKNILTSDKGAEKLFNLQLNYLVNKQKLTQFLPPEIWETKKALLAEELKNKSFELPRGFYDDLKYKMTVVIGSEAIDTAGKMGFLQTLIQTVASNPAAFPGINPKDLILKSISLAGFNPKDFEMEQVPTVQGISQNLQAQQGGSVAAPTVPTMPAQMMQTASV